MNEADLIYTCNAFNPGQASIGARDIICADITCGVIDLNEGSGCVEHIIPDSGRTAFDCLDPSLMGIICMGLAVKTLAIRTIGSCAFAKHLNRAIGHIIDKS